MLPSDMLPGSIRRDARSIVLGVTNVRRHVLDGSLFMFTTFVLDEFGTYKVDVTHRIPRRVE